MTSKRRGHGELFENSDRFDTPKAWFFGTIYGVLMLLVVSIPYIVKHWRGQSKVNHHPVRFEVTPTGESDLSQLAVARADGTLVVYPLRAGWLAGRETGEPVLVNGMRVVVDDGITSETVWERIPKTCFEASQTK